MITHNNQKGFAFIYLIVVMLILAGVGAAIYSFTTSTTYTELTENNRNRAYQLAVAGMNYAAERYAAGVDISASQFKDTTYTLGPLGNSRGTITYTVNTVTGPPSYYDVRSTGTVNGGNGLLLAKAQVRSGTQAGMPNYFWTYPASNTTIVRVTMNDLTGFNSADLTNSKGTQMVQIEGYVATGGTHLYWAAFTNEGGTNAISDGDNSGCTIGFHVARVNATYANLLQQSWNTNNHVDYDLQAKVGWYQGLTAAVSGLNFRWHETANGSGLFQGYGLAFMRYTYSASGCGSGYDYIPNSIKPPGLANELLLVLWEQRVDGGVEKRRWLAYADLGTPADYPGTRGIPTANDLKVVGAQDNVDGYLNDDALIMVRVREKLVGGQRVNEINVFYGDASPYYDPRSYNSVATDITRKRMFPEWINSALFPSWPSNILGLFNYTDAGIPYSINNFWVPYNSATTNPTYYDFFTLVSASNKIGPDPSSPTPATPVLNPVKWIINPSYLDTGTGSSIPTNTDLVTLLSDKATVRTYKFVLNNFYSYNMEVGLHGMGNLDNSTHVVAFDDLALQILGLSY